ncbi:MAG: transglutaminase-like domain-containing protein [Clostridiales bacterium]|nr:transglutaminase-like domain-containing protein [Clostridiales bacterium]
MKKISFSIIVLLFLFVASPSAFAATQFDVSNTAKGLLYVTYDGALAKKIKLTINLKGSNNTYDYDVKTNAKFSVPLQLGNGEYTVRLLENITGTSYRVLDQKTFAVTVQVPNDMFLSASPIVNFTADMTAIKEYEKIVSGDESARTSVVYERVVNDYTYDDDKAAAITAGKIVGYTPVIDDIYMAKKGICYDYSAMMAGVLRDQGVPTKLVMGFSSEIKGYHAWNEIFIGGKWVVVDTTYDSAYANAGRTYSMEKDSKDFQVVKVY